MKDKSGKDIKPGDIIVYGKALGRCAGMQYGKVLYITLSDNKYHYIGSGHPRKVEKVRFVGIDDGWYEGKSLQKPSTLEFSERILVVSRKQVNAQALKLLDGIKLADYPKPVEKK